MGDITLGIKLNFDGKAVEGGVTVSREQFRSLASEAKAAGQAAAGGFTAAAQGVRSLTEQLGRVQTAVASYFSVTQATRAATWIIEQSSAMQQLEARLRVATANATEFATAYGGVFRVANKWGAAVEQTAGAFARLNPIVAQMGGTSATTLKMLDGLAASLRLSGATAAETSAVLMQFSQAMGSGRVGGDEFRSMMENAEPLMRAVAAEMGKTTAELRQMSEEGKLTSSVFGNALLPAIDKLAAKAASIPLGISQAMEVLKNNLSRDFGKEFSDQSNRVADAIKAISEHTPEMAAAVHAGADALAELAKVGAVVAAGAVAAGLAKQAQAAYDSAAAFVATRQARIAETAAAEVQAATNLSNLQATQAAVLVDRERAVASLASANATLRGAEAAGALSFALAASRDAVAQKSAALSALASIGQMQARITQQLAAAEAEHAAALAASTQAASLGAAASRTAATASGMAGTAIAALGGPIGATITLLTVGATAWALWGDKAKESADKASDALEASLALLERYNKEAKFGAGDVGLAKAGVAAAEERIRVLRGQLAALTSEDSGGGVYTDEAKYAAIQKEIVKYLEKREKALQAVTEAERRSTQPSADGNERLSAASEYSKLVSDLKYREKIVKEYDDKLLNLQTAYRDLWANTDDAKRGHLERNHKSALKALMEERKQALEALPDFKESKASADARADALVKSYRASVKRAQEVLKQDHEQYRLPTENFIRASAAYESSAIEAEIATLKAKLAAATKDSERITIRANIEELQKDLDQVPLRTQAALEDAAAKTRDILNRMAVDAGKQLDPLAVKGREFAEKWGASMRQAAVDGNQEVIDAGAAVWKAWADQALFDDAKQKYDALFSQMQAKVEAVREAAERDGGFLAQVSADQQAAAIRENYIPALNELIGKMKEAQGASPVNEKTVSEAVRATQRATNEVSPVMRRFSEDIERGLTDSIYRGLERGGKDGAKIARETILNTLKAIPIKIGVQAIVTPVMNAAGQVLGMTGTAGSGGGLGGLFDLAKTGNNLYSLFNGGGTTSGLYSSFATSSVGEMLGLSAAGGMAAYGALGSGITLGAAGGGFGAGAGISAAAGMGGSLGSGISLGTGAATIGGEALGAGITGSLSSGAASLTSLGSTIGAALPWVGAALAVYALLSSSGVFGGGGGPKTNINTYFSATQGGLSQLSSAGGGDAMSQAIYNDVVKAIVGKYAPGNDYSVYLGGHINTKGKSSNQNAAFVAAGTGVGMWEDRPFIYNNRNPSFGKGVSDWQTWAAAEVPRLSLAIITDALRTAGGDIRDIANSVMGTADDLTTTLDAMDASKITAAIAEMNGLVDVFETIKATINPQITGEATAALVKLAGGFANLKTEVESYYSHYFSQAEQQERLAAKMAEQFQALNLAMPTSKEGFRDLVEGIQMSGMAGLQTFQALMQLEGAFAQFIDTANAAGAAAGSLADQIKTTQDATLAALEAQSRAAEDGARTARQVAADYRQAAASLADASAQLRGGDLSILSPEEKLAERDQALAAVFARAMAGDLEALGKLSGTAGDFLSASRDYNASGSAYAADFARVMDMLDQAGVASGAGAARSDYQGTLLELQVESLKEIQAQLAAPSPDAAILAEQKAMLAAIDVALRDQNSLVTSGNAITDAIRALHAANNSLSEETLRSMVEAGTVQTFTLDSLLAGSDKTVDLLQQLVDLGAKKAAEDAAAEKARAEAAALAKATGAYQAQKAVADAARATFDKSIAGLGVAQDAAYTSEDIASGRAAGYGYYTYVVGQEGKLDAVRAAYNAYLAAFGKSYDLYKAIPGHATGLERVPYDNYLARLHKDETVVDAGAVTAIRRYFGVTPAAAGGDNSRTLAELRRQNGHLEALVRQQGAGMRALLEEMAGMREEMKVLRKTSQRQGAAV